MSQLQLAHSASFESKLLVQSLYIKILTDKEKIPYNF